MRKLILLLAVATFSAFPFGLHAGRWEWSPPNQDWHYASVEITKQITRRESNVGSGTLISRKPGYIITNYHVVGDSGQCTIQWLKPGRGRVTTKGTVIAGDSGKDLALIATTPPAWVRPIHVAHTQCGDVAYQGQQVEVLGYGGSPGRGQEVLRHYVTKINGYSSGDSKFRDLPISGDSGGSIISHDGHWPRLYGVVAYSQNRRSGGGPSDVLVGKFLGRIFGRNRGQCGPDGCEYGDDDHPDHPGDRPSPEGWGQQPPGSTPDKPGLGGRLGGLLPFGGLINRPPAGTKPPAQNPLQPSPDASGANLPPDNPNRINRPHGTIITTQDENGDLIMTLVPPEDASSNAKPPQKARDESLFSLLLTLIVGGAVAWLKGFV
jgi:hypothetical protein